MNRFNFTVLCAVLRALHSITTKGNTKARSIPENIKDDTIIKFKNGSDLKILTSKESARGNRGKLYPRPTEDFISDWYIDKETFDEILVPFCKERENNDIDSQILYVSSNKKRWRK